MAVADVHLISKHGTSPPTTVSLNVSAIAANLAFLDRPLKKAGQSELRPLFETDEKTWLRPADVLSAFENARKFFDDPRMDEILFEVVVEQLGPAADVLRALPKGSVMRLEIIKSKPRKPAKSKPARTGSSGSGAASSLVKTEMPKEAASAVAEAMSKDETRLSFEGFIANWMQRDATEAIANVRKHWHPDWPQVWLELKVRFDWICDPMNGWYLRGVARRFSSGDLDEFVQFIQMHVRQYKLLNARPGDTDVWELLRALAIRDQEAVGRYVAETDFPLQDGHPDTRTIYNGVQALLRSDKAQLDVLQQKELSDKKPAWLTGIIRCLQGIAARDPARVALGVHQHLDGFRKAFRIHPLEKIVSLEAHGLYRLAEQIDPQLVRDVDMGRGLPWDQEFHIWSTKSRPRLTVAQFGKKCPKPLAEALVTLERPEWA